MNFKSLLECALLGAIPSFARSGAVVKILHLQTNPKIIAIWKDAALTSTLSERVAGREFFVELKGFEDLRAGKRYV